MIYKTFFPLNKFCLGSDWCLVYLYKEKSLYVCVCVCVSVFLTIKNHGIDSSSSGILDVNFIRNLSRFCLAGIWVTYMCRIHGLLGENEPAV